MEFIAKQAEIELLNEKILFQQHSLFEIGQKRRVVEEAKAQPSSLMFSGGLFIETDTKAKLEDEIAKLETKESLIKNEIPAQIERLKELQAGMNEYWK